MASADALDVLDRSQEWYRRHATQARVLFYSSEVAILVVAALIPAAAAFTKDRRVPAALGALVVILTGLRAIFRWRESWVRFIEAVVQLETERQLYVLKAGRYRTGDRDVTLVERVREIETLETRGWIEMRLRQASGETESAGEAGSR